MKYLLLLALLIGGIYAYQTKLDGMARRPYVVQLQNVEAQQEVEKIKKALNGYPAQKYAHHFWKSADKYRMDWRILVYIAFRESTFFRNDGCVFRGGVNGFGYYSNSICFDSYPNAIDHVAQKLAIGNYYKQHTNIVDKLCMYNKGTPNNCEYGQSYLAYKNIW